MAVVETSVPRIVTSSENLSVIEPRIHYYADDPVFGDGVLDWMYTSLSRRYGELQVGVKAFELQPHGKNSVERVGLVSSSSLQEGIDAFSRRVSQEEDSICIPAVSGVFTVSGGSKFVIPMLDLEQPATGTSEIALHNDLQEIGSRLTQTGLTGCILRSGDVGRGSYHFVGDYALPYEPNYWQYMGWFMTTLVNNGVNSAEGVNNVSQSLEYGTKLVAATSLADAQSIASSMLDSFPSIKSGETREGLFFDPRWIAHRLSQGINTLRLTVPTKGYKERPRLVAEIY